MTNLTVDGWLSGGLTKKSAEDFSF